MRSQRPAAPPPTTSPSCWARDGPAPRICWAGPSGRRTRPRSPGSARRPWPVTRECCARSRSRAAARGCWCWAPAPSIPGFRPPAVAGHAGVLRSIEVEGSGARVLVLGARTHLYEGAGVDPVVHGVRTAAAAGCGTMVLTNGCGGVDPARPPGTPVLISDQINHTGATPLAEANFVDLTDLYTPALRDLAREVDDSLGEGVYMQFRGPSYETPAEVQMARIIGASLIGMSTALEAIAAREAGMDILGISLVTNLAAGISPEPLSHEEVLQAGKDAGP